LLNENESILDQLSRKKDVDESEEEPESYVQTHVKAENASTASFGSASIGSGNSGDVRIKIRKNSMDPHMKIKSTYSQVI